MKKKNIYTLISTLCILMLLTAGCSSPNTQTPTPKQEETPTEQTEPNSASPTEEEQPPETTEASKSTEGRWHVVSPEIAAILDADFEGIVWKIESDTFYIAECFTEILEDGSIAGGSPSPDADIPDSDLIQVLFDEDTHFYLRTIYGGGESHEDTEASFQDLEPYMQIDLKGSFTNDIFHATEIRLIKVEQ